MNALPIISDLEAYLHARIEAMQHALQQIATTDLHAVDHRDFERRAKSVAHNALVGKS